MIIEQLKNALEYLLSDFPAEGNYLFSLSTLRFLNRCYGILLEASDWTIEDYKSYVQLVADASLRQCKRFFEYELIQLLLEPELDIETEIKNYCQGYINHISTLKEAYDETLEDILYSCSKAQVELPHDKRKFQKLAKIMYVVREIKEQEPPNALNARIKKTNSSYLQILTLARKYNVGNCGEIAKLFIYHLAKRNFYGEAEYVYFDKLDHVFCVINRLSNSELNDYTTWGEDCIIVDPWCKKIYYANEMLEKLQGIDYQQDKLVNFDPQRDKFLTHKEDTMTNLIIVNHQMKVKLLEETIESLVSLLSKTAAAITRFNNLYFTNRFFSASGIVKNSLLDNMAGLNDFKKIICEAIKKLDKEKESQRNYFVDLLELKNDLDNSLINYHHNFNFLTDTMKQNMWQIKNKTDSSVIKIINHNPKMTFISS